MNEEFDERDGSAADGAAPEPAASAQAPAVQAEATAVEHTGNHVVDRVLHSVDALDDVPVDEHVAIFERAHEELRGALDGPRLPRP